MSWLSDFTELVPGAWLSSAYPGHGIRGDAVPSTGTHGAALILESLSLPLDAAKEYRLFITAFPPGLATCEIGEDTSIYADDSNGTYAGGLGDLYEDGVLLGPVGFTVVIGAGVDPTGPRIAFNPRLGEVLTLVMDSAGLPIAARRPNGATLVIHPVEGAMLGRAVTDAGELLIII